MRMETQLLSPAGYAELSPDGTLIVLCQPTADSRRYQRSAQCKAPQSVHVRLATWRTHMQSTDSSSITSSIVTQNGWCSLRNAQISLLRFCRFASAFVASFMSPDSET